MKIKNFRLLHDAMFCAVVGALISGAFMLTTGRPMGIIPALGLGYMVMKALEVAMAKRRATEVGDLTSMYDKPSSTEK